MGVGLNDPGYRRWCHQLYASQGQVEPLFQKLKSSSPQSGR
jgi:hypothetical protein